MSHSACCASLNQTIGRTDIPTLPRRRHRYYTLVSPSRTRPAAEAMLHPILYRAAIRKICAELRIPLLAPTVDCFAARANAQTVVGCMYIDREMDFLARTFDCPRFWRDCVAWAHPPCDSRTLHATIDKFATRRIRGFVCGPKWPKIAGTDKEVSNLWLQHARSLRSYAAEVSVGGRLTADTYLSETTGYKSDGGCPCNVDTIVVYFDGGTKAKW